ncbi:MAG: GNAT family N-acetyltransferase [Hyphomonadaceae bacterium]|nr:GNAT family N-acetyltransferase [Hyphomonadaceae bacterium]
MIRIRVARLTDMPALKALMDAAIGELQGDFLAPQEIVASREVMGIDTQLIKDGTYFIAELDGALAGCGGWSRRATLYGGDHSEPLRDASLLDPARDSARVRAMYTHPKMTRRGVGRAVLAASEDAARAAGFKRAELMATLAGEPLYRASGYVEEERTFSPDIGGVRVPLVRMSKALV